MLPRDPVTGVTGEPSALVEDAHERDLLVHVWTLRDENRFLATNFRRGNDPDRTDTTVEARQEWWDASARAS